MPDRVLALETSCDETSAAILVREGYRPTLASLVVLSQDVHRIFGGVVPELASRAHLSTVDAVVATALAEAEVTLAEIDAMAVTAGPGLLGSLLVGVCYAKSLAAATARPLVGVNHLEGHVFAPVLEYPELEPPFVALLVSGGHTMLIDVQEWGSYRLLGRTRDDAAGEAFDKVASMLNLAYPGGPEIERLAKAGIDRYSFPRPMMREGLDFSFSGLKTAVLHAVRASSDPEADAADIAASFQAAALEVLATKLRRALEETGYRRAVIGGGVACNRTLVSVAKETIGPAAELYVASPRFNSDNAAMIGRAGWFHLDHGRSHDGKLDADARFPWPGLHTSS